MGLRELVVFEDVPHQTLANHKSKLQSILRRLTSSHVAIIGSICGETRSNAISFGAAAAAVMGYPGLSFERGEESSRENVSSRDDHSCTACLAKKNSVTHPLVTRTFWCSLSKLQGRFFLVHCAQGVAPEHLIFCWRQRLQLYMRAYQSLPLCHGAHDICRRTHWVPAS